MTDAELMQTFFRLIITVVILPALGFIWWYVKGVIRDVSLLRDKQSKSEQNHAVILVMVENIKEDIKEIKFGIEKMLDRRSYHPKSNKNL